MCKFCQIRFLSRRCSTQVILSTHGLLPRYGSIMPTPHTINRLPIWVSSFYSSWFHRVRMAWHSTYNSVVCFETQCARVIYFISGINNFDQVQVYKSAGPYQIHVHSNGWITACIYPRLKRVNHFGKNMAQNEWPPTFQDNLNEWAGTSSQPCPKL